MPRRREGPVKNKQTGYYFFDSYVGLGPDRKRIRFSLHTKDPGRAQFLFEQEWKRLWAEYYGVKNPKLQGQTRLSDIIPEFIAYERQIKKVKSWRMFDQRLWVINDILGNPPIVEINQKELIRLDQTLRTKRGVKPYTINHYFGLLKTLFNYVIDQGKHPGPNPIKKFKPYPVDRKRRSFTDEEISRIVKAAEQVEREARLETDITRYAKRIVMMLLLTGMRAGELLNLKWQNIRDGKIVLRRTETKQKREKVIPITAGIQRILNSVPKRKPEDRVFPFSQDGLRKYTRWIIHRIRKISGIQDFDFHSLRHTSATIMVSESLGKGVGLADIMKVLGHSRMDTTLRYLHEDEKRMKKAVEIIEDRFLKEKS